MSIDTLLGLDGVIREAASIVAQKLGVSPEGLVKHYSHPMDGLELAKELEKHEFWDTTSEDVDILHDMEHIIYRLLAERHS